MRLARFFGDVEGRDERIVSPHSRCLRNGVHLGASVPSAPDGYQETNTVVVQAVDVVLLLVFVARECYVKFHWHDKHYCCRFSRQVVRRYTMGKVCPVVSKPHAPILIQRPANINQSISIPQKTNKKRINRGLEGVIVTRDQRRVSPVLCRKRLEGDGR